MEEKNRIVEASRIPEYWRLIASANCVPIATAYRWIRKFDDVNIPTERKRGGARNKKITIIHKQKMIQYVENDPLIIKHKLQRDQRIKLSITTIHNHLECQFYSIKKVLSLNSIENKTKRAAYVK